jgi:hypothetical protein
VVRGRVVACTFQLADGDLGAPLALPKERTATRDEARAGERALLDYVAARVQVRNGDFPCAARPRGVTLVDKSGGFFAVAAVDYECKRSAADVTVRYDLFFDLDPRHQGLARVTVGDQPERQHVFRAEARELSLAQPLTLVDHVRDYVLLGVEHIFTGYDHLAFLFGLLVVAGLVHLGRGLRYVLGVVTAFTVAHSCTLVAAGIGWVRLPPRVVEPAIALSILWVALENLAVAQPRRRWVLTFGFGLVHGFGFASVLREIGLPPRGVVPSLLAFNVGVELGQLAVVALVAPALHLLAREPRRPLDIVALLLLAVGAVALLSRFALPLPSLLAVAAGAPVLLLALVPRLGYDAAVRRGGSTVLMLLATLWLVERVAGRVWLDGWLG